MLSWAYPWISKEIAWKWPRDDLKINFEMLMHGLLEIGSMLNRAFPRITGSKLGYV